MSSREKARENLDENLIEKRQNEANVSEVSETSTKKVPKFVPIFILMYTSLEWTSVASFFEFPILFEGALIERFGITPVEIGYFIGATYFLPLFFQVKFGKMMDRLGQFKSNVAIQSLLLFSIFLAYLGLVTKWFWLMLVSRALYGICFCSMFVVISSMGNSWATSWITLFLGLNRSFANFFLGGFNYFQPLIYLRYHSLIPPLLMYSLTAIFCIVLSFVYFKVENKYYRLINIENKVKDQKTEEERGDEEQEEKQKLEGAVFKLKDIARVPLISKVIAVTIIVVPFCHRIFRMTAIDLIMIKFEKTYLEAKNALAVYPLSNMILLLSFSFIFAAIGKKSFGLVTSAIGYLTCYLILLLSSTGVQNWVVYLAFAILGFSASSYRSCSWASLLITLPKQACTVMVALIVQIQAFCITFLPILIGFVTKDRTPQAYDNQIWMFLCLAGAIFAIYVWVCFYDLAYCAGMLTKVDSHKDVKEYKDRVTSKMEEYLKGKAGPLALGDVMELGELGGDKNQNLNR